MADKQVLVENGRVSLLFQVIVGLAVLVIGAGIIGTFSTLDRMEQQLGELSKQLEISNVSSTYERATLDSRVTILERKFERTGNRDDN